MKGEISHKDPIAAQDVASLRALDDVACGVQPLQFKKVEDYTTFLAEYAWDGDDLVFHFFRTPEMQGQAGPPAGLSGTQYWRLVFPEVLDPVAREVFQAGPPRLRAAYTEEMDSWWLRASNYGHLIDKDAFVSRFLAKLDQTLDTTSST